jgi:hypothetical protein
MKKSSDIKYLFRFVFPFSIAYNLKYYAIEFKTLGASDNASGLEKSHRALSETPEHPATLGLIITVVNMNADHPCRAKLATKDERPSQRVLGDLLYIPPSQSHLHGRDIHWYTVLQRIG